MEKNKERVLAYTLARELSHQELAEVSGGGCLMTSQLSFKPSGSSLDNLDAVLDFKVDC